MRRQAMPLLRFCGRPDRGQSSRNILCRNAGAGRARRRLGTGGEGGGVKGIDFGAALREEGDVRAVGSLRAAVVRGLYPKFGIGATIGDGLMFA